MFLMTGRAGLRRCGAQLGTISVGPGSQSTCTKVCRIGRGAQIGSNWSNWLRPALMTGISKSTICVILSVGKNT